MPDDEPMVALLARAGGTLCALPLTAVIETMRPLTLEAIPGGPDCVAGISIVRGRPILVLDLARLLTPRDGPAATRLVVMRVGDREVGLLVEVVLGVRNLPGHDVSTLPPLLGQAQAISELGVRDGELLRVLSVARAVPPDILHIDIPEAMAS